MQVFRGTAIVFESTFKDVDGTPLTPADSTAYPQIQIKDPEGTVISIGVGGNLGEGKYQFSWTCADDATINTRDNQWKIEWFFVTATGHSKSAEQAFDVVDKVEADPRERQQTYLVREGGRARLMIRHPRRINQISMTVKFGGNVVQVSEGIATNDQESALTNPNRKLTESVVDGTYVYYYDTNPLKGGEYLIFWDIQESLVTPVDTAVQIMRVVPDQFWHYSADLRMLVDRLQKHIGMVQAYDDAVLWSYLKAGLDTINFYAPTTNWLLNEIPIDGSHGVHSALLYASAIHALIAQQILEEEISFQHTGQIVSLTVKHDYGNVLTAIKGQLDEFGKAKQQIFIQAEGVGWSGVRPKSYRVLRTVFRVDKAFGPGFLPPGGGALLQNIGL